MSRPQWLIVACLFLMSGFINIRNLSLSKQIREAERQSALAPGETLSAMEVQMLDGFWQFPIEEDFQAERPQLILLFSPLCGYCKENLPNWASIEQAALKRNYKTLAISTLSDEGRLVEYRQALSSPIAIAVNEGELAENKLLSTPQTLLVDESGRIQKIWVGVASAEEVVAGFP